MFKSSLLRWLTLTPYSETPGTGSGGGSGAGSGGGAGTGSGAGAGAGGGLGAGAGTGGSAPYKLTSDSLVDLGDGKPVKWSDLTSGEQARFIPRDRFDRGVEFLTGEARRLEQEWAKYRAGQGRKPDQPDPQQQRPDPMADVRALPVVAGNDLDRVIRSLYDSGFAPLAQAVAQIAARNTQLEQAVKGLTQRTGSLDEERAYGNFENDITKAIGDIGEIKGLGIPDAKHEGIRELAKDVFLSHEQGSWKPGELAKSVRGRLESLFTLFRTMQKTEVEAAKERRKNAFLNPQRGNGSGSGEARYQHKTGRDIAAALFGSQEQQT